MVRRVRRGCPSHPLSLHAPDCLATTLSASQGQYMNKCISECTDFTPIRASLMRERKECGSPVMTD